MGLVLELWDNFEFFADVPIFFSLPSSSSIVVAVLTCCCFAILILSVVDMTELSPIRLSPFRRVAVLFVADPTCRRFDRIPSSLTSRHDRQNNNMTILML